MKTDERHEARRLRREEGRSVKEIARLVGVSRSSVSLWVRDIELTSEQREALLRSDAVRNGQLIGSKANATRARERRRAYQEEGRRLARRGEAFHAAGCMLYWAEGDKSRTAVCLVNSDPQMLVFFLAFLRRYYHVDDERVRVACNLFADHEARQREIEDFWLDTLDLPRACLRKSIVNVYSKYSKKKRRNRLPYGTCRLIVCETRIVQSIYGSIQEYAGFVREEWLD